MSRADVSDRAQVELGDHVLDEFATALSDQSSFVEHHSMMDPRTGELLLWSSYGGIDGKNPVDLEELDLVRVDAIPSYVWCNDMADFAARISDANAAERLSDAFADNRACIRAVGWLLEHGFTDQATADAYFEQHRDPQLP